MNLNSIIKMTGELSIKKFNSNKELIEETHVPNLVVTAGKNHVANRIVNGNLEPVMSHMGVGSNSTAAALANTTLGYQLAREALSSISVNGANITYTATFDIGVATGSITEAAIFNDATTGTMMCRTTFPVITKLSNESIAISWTITVG